jgi:type IV pilus assembly protein PilY1
MIMAALLCFIPAAVWADDTEIYGTTSVALKPNVLIIMDNSGSMGTKDVGGEDYINTKDYSLYPATGYTPKPSTAVYYEISAGGTSTWNLVASTAAASDITKLSGCSTLVNQLNTKGYANKYVFKLSNLSCSGSTKYNFKLGNFLNYENSTMLPEYRYVVAKRAIAKILDTTTDKRFGLMHYNGSSEGGYIKYPCGTDNTTISTYIKNMTSSDFSTWTPLAETLAEAGLYFAGMSSWFNSGIKYTSPIQEVCQKNYIIIMTDGEPTQDDNTKLWQTIYMNGKKIGDFDKDGEDFDKYGNVIHIASNGTLLLNDVAAFLFNEDINTMGAGTSFVKQNIITHTIGLTTQQDLLYSTAKNGGGNYYYANTASGLDAALESINNSINETTAVFLAPSVPVNRASKTSDSDWIYLAFFKPQSTGEWIGNIKKFALGPQGQIYGKAADGSIDTTSGSVVDDYGQIKDNACSFWTVNCNDGNDAMKGGLGEQLDLRTTPRNIYYYLGNANLTDASNAVTTDNNSMPWSDAVIEAVRNFKDTWKLGAIIHSEPAIVHYSNTQSAIFVGANDGMLHCFDDTNGSEVWGFIPPGQKDRIANISDAQHDYYIDGSPTVSYAKTLISGTQHYQPQYLVFGERRGGDHYYVLDINDYKLPQWKYKIDPTILGAEETLGQSWSKPVVCTLATGTQTVNGVTTPGGLTEVFLIGGGYDSVNQDVFPPTSSTDTVGKAILAFKTSDGTLSSGGKYYFKVTDANTEIIGATLKNSIISVKSSSTYTAEDGTDVTTRIYAGDLGGKLFVFSDDLEKKTVSGVSTMQARAAADGTFPTKVCLFQDSGKKIFYAPGVSRMSNTFSEYVVFGTGDREKPTEKTVQNGIYIVQNTWLNTTPYTKSDLVDLTENLIVEGTTDEKKNTQSALIEKHGWYINFYDPGEKLTSAPIITQGHIYFTTYVPPGSTTTSTDACANVGASGVSYLWSIELDTGIPVHDVNGNNVKEKQERRKQVAVMAQPTLTGNLISTPATELVEGKINTNYFFWQQK